MAGHSKFKNIMHRKGAQDRMRAKLFSRLGREILIATKIGGAEIDSNIRLRSAINLAGVLTAAIFVMFKACLDKNLKELIIPQDFA